MGRTRLRTPAVPLPSSAALTSPTDSGGLTRNTCARLGTDTCTRRGAGDPPSRTSHSARSTSATGYLHHQNQYMYRLLQCFRPSARTFTPSAPILLCSRFNLRRLLKFFKSSARASHHQHQHYHFLDSVSVGYCSALDHQQGPSHHQHQYYSFPDSVSVGYCSVSDHKRGPLHHQNQYYLFL